MEVSFNSIESTECLIMLEDQAFSAGKLDMKLLKSLLARVKLDSRVLVGPGVGEDAAVIDFGDRCLVCKTDPVTFATDDIGWYAVHINANDLATMGATPRWFMATVLLPEGSCDETLIGNIFEQVTTACHELNVSLVGGHTEVTHDLNRPIVVGSMMGEVHKEKLVMSSGAQEGDAIVLTKKIPLEGTALIAREKESELLAAGYEQTFIASAQKLLREPGISVVKDAIVASSVAKIHAMHDPTEGGLATALHELAVAADVGILVDQESVPMVASGEQLCREFDLDPFGVIASGALLIVVGRDDAKLVVDTLRDSDIQGTVIGEVLPVESGVLLRRGGHKTPLTLYTKDEITKLFEFA